MAAGVLTIDNQLVRIIEHRLITVGRQIPHANLVAGLNGGTEQIMVLQGGTPHMRQRRLPTNDFAHRVGDELRILLQLFALVGEAVQSIGITGHRIACRVVSAHDEQNEVTHILKLAHVLHR